MVNHGQPAARNRALREASGRLICYLDSDDEYHDGYLELVWKYLRKSEVALFGYDVVADTPEGCRPLGEWNPAGLRGQLFQRNITAPLGIAHRRELADEVGGFDERLWRKPAWDFLKRLARTGADFGFVPRKAGIRHLRSSGRARKRPTVQQRGILTTNWQANKPIFAGRNPFWKRSRSRSIVFASQFSAVDQSSGAAVATLNALDVLSRSGLSCQAYCSSKTDHPEEVCFEQLLSEMQIPYEGRKVKLGDYDATMLFAQHGRVPLTVFRSASTRSWVTGHDETAAFLSGYEVFLERNRPDVVITYGGDELTGALIALTKRRDIPVVFALHNVEYYRLGPFRSVDYVTVPSQFARQAYWNRMGLAAITLPNAIDWRRVQVAEERKPRYVTLINPSPEKGGRVFARIAEQLHRRRPDIRLLVVESRAKAKALGDYGLEGDWLQAVRVMEHQADPRRFYAVSKILLMPSLWQECFGLVAAEAMINGIPVLASNRGALPETVNEAGFLFDVPTKYTPFTTEPPTAGEVEPWVETIIRLWDDKAFYQAASQRALAHADRWRPEKIAPLYKEFFENVFQQPGPPIVPKEQVESPGQLH